MFDSHAVRDEIILRLSDSSYEESVASQLSDGSRGRMDLFRALVSMAWAELLAGDRPVKTDMELPKSR